MPRKSLRCIVEINVHAVTCPGVWLPRRDPLFLTFSLLNQVRHTQVVSPVFPLLFHEKFTIDKVFYCAYEPSQVASSLVGERIRIELVQESGLYNEGGLLASFTGNVRDFIYPNPSSRPAYGTQDREVLMQRSLNFPGISPRLEFSTRSTIKETSATLDDDLDEEPFQFRERKLLRTTAQNRRARSRSRCLSRPRGYRGATISSLSRSRSVSPTIYKSLDDLDLSPIDLGERPPFVVRKVDSRTLIGRKPGEAKNRGRSKSSSRRRRRRSHSLGYRSCSPYYGLENYGSRPGFYSPNIDDCYSSFSRRPIRTKVIRERVDARPRISRSRPTSPLSDPASLDSEVERLTRRYAGRATSPLLSRPPLIRRYYGNRVVPSTSELISRRVRNALSTNRSSSSRSVSRSYQHSDDDDSLDQLAVDLQRARYRDYYI